MNKLVLLIIIITTFLCFHDGVVGQMLNVPRVIQEQDQWCWAAVSTCVLQYYGTDINQCTIAEYTRTRADWHDFGSVDCCVDPGQGCNYWNYLWGDPGSIQDILQHWGVNSYGYYPYLSLTQIQDELGAARPFIMRWGWTTGGGHFLVGYGLAGSTLYYMDPWFGNGYEIADYSWVVSASDHDWTHTEVLTNFVDNPLPPSNFTAYSDYLTPTSVALHWLDPTMTRNYYPLSNFKIHIYRDSLLIAEVDSGVMSYTDTGLVNHRNIVYRARAIMPIDSGLSVSASCYVGGSPDPQQPLAFTATDGGDGVHFSWTNPSRQADGTPLNDFGAILIFRDGVLFDSVIQTSRDTGQQRSLVEPTTGYHWYVLRTRDTEVPGHWSPCTDSMLAYGNVGYSYGDDFEQGTDLLYRTGLWDTTHSMAYSGIASMTDSPIGNSPGSTISYVYLPPVILRDESVLRFYHIAIVNTATSLASVDISTNSRRTFKQLANFNWNSYPEWVDSVADPGDWKIATFNLSSYLDDTVTLRLRMFTTTGQMGDGWYIDSLSISPTNPVVTFPCAIASGWNLLSLPVRTTQHGCTDIYPCAVSAAFVYNGSYNHIDSVCPGIGYWLKFDSSAIVPVTGLMLTHDSILLTPGWNLVGTITGPVNVSTISTRPANIVTSAFYGFDGAYSTATTLEPAHGYWVRSKQSGALILRSIVSGVSEKSGLPIVSPIGGNNENQLIFTDAEAHKQILTFGVGDRHGVSPESYDLPPLPPDGIFDIRFGTQASRVMVREPHSQDCEIDLQGIHYPIVLRWNVDTHDGSVWGIVSDSVCFPIRGTGKIVLSVAPGRLALRLLSMAGGNLPLYYSLEQNFPNPFNPTTTIRYQLPAESYVTIKILNILGDVVQVLADETQDPGFRSIEWNAAALASGIYFCRLHAVNSTDPASTYLQTRKMMLIK